MFWTPAYKSQRIALSCGERQVTYSELSNLCRSFVHSNNMELVFDRSGNDSHEANDKRLILFRFNQSIESIVAYLSLLCAGHALILIDPAIEKSKQNNLTQSYTPHAEWDGESLQTLHKKQISICRNVAILIPTSGSTGSAKMVALSYENLTANAKSIAEYLSIDTSDIALGTLPLHYAYGLSVLHSHLLCGAQFRLCKYSPMERLFWQELENKKITSLSGVPSWYAMLYRMGFTKRNYASLKYFTQAGGKLSSKLASAFAEYAVSKKKRFYIMYGQTEATARMAFLAPEKAAEKPHAIGRAIPGGKLQLRNEKSRYITKPNTEGELIYSGPNIMLGYVKCLDELSSFSALDTLNTGDLGYFDEQGDFVITGRKNRIAKLNGIRISLDEVQTWLEDFTSTAVVCVSDDSFLFVAFDAKGSVKSEHWLKPLCEYIGINQNLVKHQFVDAIPMLANGKTDYQSVLARAGAA